MMNFFKGKYIFVVSVIYVCGFVVWNLHLARFGYFEYDLLQTRFISAGILVSLSSLILFMLIVFIVKLFSHRAYSFFVDHQGIFLLLFTLAVIVSGVFVFPTIPQYLGGGRPYLGSIIVDESASNEYKEMGLMISDVESLRGCKIYENRNIFIFGFIKNEIRYDKEGDVLISPDRVLIINRDKIDAVSVLPQGDPGLQYHFGTSSKTVLTQYRVRCNPIFSVFKFI